MVKQETVFHALREKNILPTFNLSETLFKEFFSYCV